MCRPCFRGDHLYLRSIRQYQTDIVNAGDTFWQAGHVRIGA
ncbi:hypothetical protein Z946_1239 [Sulfitobacter noctilucicola]|nr:hypothetical protein Z946_1239 [Sulfitobacter noctilucicola]